jgi:hypothetical protein
LCCFVFGAAGCGEGGGVGDGATATVYVAAGACDQAKRALGNEGERVGSLRVRVACVPSTEEAGRFDLAQIGANVRRATEDSTTIAYVGELDPTSVRFSETILEAAGIAQLPEMPGSKAVHKLLPAIEQALDEGGNLRQSVYDQLR